ncbi:MAG: hypothetical protein PHZ00_02000 [Candidatus Peribacteraceae bacterium]|nr:hypothetical protein [Candidatus Peribacteraceae bacterium]
MSMNIRELHDEIEIAKVGLVLNGMRGISSNHYQLTRPVFAEALIKDPALPKSFGKAFDEIMEKKYGTESVGAGSLTRDLDLTGTRDLIERANLQLHAIISLLDEIKKWIERTDESFRHSGNLDAFGENLDEFFEKGESFGSDWGRIVTAFKTFCAEKLLPAYTKSPQLKDYCMKVSAILDADQPPKSEQQKKTLKKKMDDLQWYFDNYCLGTTKMPCAIAAPRKSQIAEKITPPKLKKGDAPENAVYAFDGRLMALDDGAVYVDGEKANDLEPAVGQTLYALLGKGVGYVSYIDIAKAIYGERVREPATGRRTAIRKYVSTLRTILLRYFSECDIENERGKGWTFVEHSSRLVAVA